MTKNVKPEDATLANPVADPVPVVDPVADASPPELPDDQLLAAIDIGSNSFHLIIARLVLGALQPVQRRKEQVQLAAGLNQDLELSDEAIQRGIACLEDMGKLLRDNTLDQVRIVGTHTLRAARNRDVFLTLAERAVGFPVEVIAGREEARLIFQGVAHTHQLAGQTLVIDIGGGSTEFALGEGFEPQICESVRMGCVSFTERFFKNGLNAKAFKAASAEALRQLEPCLHGLQKAGWKQVLGTSGTAKALARAVIVDGESDPEQIRRTDLKKLQAELIEAGDTSILKNIGVNDSRIALVPAGLSILLSSMEALGIKSIRYCDAALREGILYEMDSQMRHDDIRLRTRHSLQARYRVDTDHASQVAKCCEYFIGELSESWFADKPRETRLLIEAAHLHEVGLYISSSDVQRHTGYLLSNCDMPGYNQEQQLTIAIVAASFRKRLRSEQFPELRSLSLQSLFRLVRLLRLAVLLNNHRMPIDVGQFSLSADGAAMRLCLPAGFLESHPLVAADLEQESEYLSRMDCVLEYEAC